MFFTLLGLPILRPLFKVHVVTVFLSVGRYFTYLTSLHITMVFIVLVIFVLLAVLGVLAIVLLVDAFSPLAQNLDPKLLILHPSFEFP